MFANDPLVNLLRLRKDRPVMTQDELRAHVNSLRTLRTSPQALGRQLRADSVAKEKVAKEPVEVKVDTKKGAADLYGSLGL